MSSWLRGTPTAVAIALSGSVVAGPAVDRGYLQTHRPQIRRELSPMVDQIEMKEPKYLAQGSLQKNLFASVQLLNQRWHDYNGLSPEEGHGRG